MALTEKLTAIANAIRAKTGGTATLTLDEMPTEIASIQTGGGGSVPAPVSANDVTFYDYDGTMVASYTIAQAQALTALPDAPTHDGLVFQGWNWSLEDVNALTRPMNVGAMYITDDGKTRLYIHIADKARSTVPLYFSQTVANGVTIDWGDGSATETLSGTGNKNTSHAYGAAGDFTISLTVADGCTLGLGNESKYYCVLGNVNSVGIVYCNMLQCVEIGRGVTKIGSYSFYNCYSLASITIPNGVTSIGGQAAQNCFSLTSITIPNGVTSIGYQAAYNCYYLTIITIPNGVTSIGNGLAFNCYSLKRIALPNGVTSIGEDLFYNCRTLKNMTIHEGVTSIGKHAFDNCSSITSITIPDSVTSINNYAFQNCNNITSITIPNGVTSIADYALLGCHSISSITIPDGVTTIKTYAFMNCYGVAEYHLKPTTPPTLSSTNAFSGIPSGCIIYVPKGCLEAYKTATNWTTYASYMQEEP